MSLVKSFGYAFRGLTAAVREQRNLKIHLGVALLVTALGFWFDVSGTDWCILVIMIGLVIAAELINTALENLTDLVTQEFHPLAGKVKDIAAASVLVLSIISVIVGFIVFYKYV